MKPRIVTISLIVSPDTGGCRIRHAENRTINDMITSKGLDWTAAAL
jgi:hypothetical protein